MKSVKYFLAQINNKLRAAIAISSSRICLVVIFSSAITSCKKFVAVDAPNDQVVAATVFADDATAIAAINGLYGNAMDFNNSILNGGVTLCAGLSADEIYNRNSNSEDDAFRSNAVRPESENILNWLWAPAYSHIYHSNAIIEGCNSSTALSLNVKQQVLGGSKIL